MKKKVLIGAGIAVVIIMVTILLFRIKKSASASDNNGIDEVKATWSVENYVKGEDKASSVVDNAKEIDTDPNSKTVLVNKQYSIDKAYKPFLFSLSPFSLQYALASRNGRPNSPKLITIN